MTNKLNNLHLSYRPSQLEDRNNKIFDLFLNTSLKFFTFNRNLEQMSVTCDQVMGKVH